MRRRTFVAGSVVLAGGAIAAAAVGFGGAAGKQDPTKTAALSTAPVTRADLTQAQTVGGVLGYGPPVTVNASGHGRITWLPALGSTVKRGQPLYKVDNRPVTLFYGSLPLYRSLRSGDTGADARQARANLLALGYSGFSTAAVRKWQKDIGAVQTAVIEPEEVVVAAAAVRVTAHLAALGGTADGPVIAYAGTTRVVTIALDVALQSLAKLDLEAEVTLPDGKQINGSIAAVGTVATPGSDEHHPATLEVTVSIQDQSTLGSLDQAPVTVKLISSTVRNVLTVPVIALVALAEGGYGVQLPDGGYVAVQPGMFANGRVEIAGTGIGEGTLVVVPS